MAQGLLEPLLANPDLRRNTLVVVTFDESGENSPSNHIYTVFLGSNVHPGEVNGRFDHFNILHTIEANFGLPPLAKDGDGRAEPIAGLWQ